MASHTRSDIDIQNRRQLVALLTAMHLYSSRGETTHERVLLNIEFWEGRPKLDRFLLLELVRDQSPPATSSAPVATNAGENARSAIGGI